MGSNNRFFSMHWLAIFTIMGAAALILGTSVTCLFMLFESTVSHIAAHGSMAAMDGAYQKLGLLLLNGIGMLGAYLLFKTCEKELVERLQKSNFKRHCQTHRDTHAA